jgi:hypothetical protein
MNGHWNEYCAFAKDGSSKGPRYSTAAFRRAFARTALIARGGRAADLNPNDIEGIEVLDMEPLAPKLRRETAGPGIALRTAFQTLPSPRSLPR